MSTPTHALSPGRFRAAFPHDVEGWEETYPDGGQLLTTHAEAAGRQRLAYWELNRPGDEAWRDSLGLTRSYTSRLPDGSSVTAERDGG